jgi:hypothetical protein
MGNLVFCTICGAPLDPADAIEVNGKWYCNEHASEQENECEKCTESEQGQPSLLSAVCAVCTHNAGPSDDDAAAYERDMMREDMD